MCVDQLEAELKAIDWENRMEWDEEQQATLFKHCGGSIYTCTSYVWELMDLYPGRIHGFGFLRKDNPDALTGHEVGGHDFAMMDDRWLVDPWLHYCVSPNSSLPTERIAFDLHGEADELLRLYGAPDLWTRLHQV